MLNNTRNEILEYIPQRQPIVMIDAVESFDHNQVVCKLTVRESNMFVAEGKLLEAGIIENIAQTIAAGAGCRAKMQNQKVRLGYIAAIKKLSISALPSVGETVTTCVQVLNEVFNVSIVQASVTCGETMIAECEMRIFLEETQEIK